MLGMVWLETKVFLDSLGGKDVLACQVTQVPATQELLALKGRQVTLVLMAIPAPLAHLGRQDW